MFVRGSPTRHAEFRLAVEREPWNLEGFVRPARGNYLVTWACLGTRRQETSMVREVCQRVSETKTKMRRSGWKLVRALIRPSVARSTHATGKSLQRF